MVPPMSHRLDIFKYENFSVLTTNNFFNGGKQTEDEGLLLKLDKATTTSSSFRERRGHKKRLEIYNSTDCFNRNRDLSFLKSNKICHV